MMSDQTQNGVGRTNEAVSALRHQARELNERVAFFRCA